MLTQVSDKLLAQVSTSLGTIGGPGLGPFGDIAGTGNEAPLKAITNVISVLIGFMTVVAGIFFFFQVLIGGLEWISSTGDKAKLEKAQGRITNGLLGLIIVTAAYGLIGFVGSLLGLDIFLKDTSFIINALQLKGP